MFARGVFALAVGLLCCVAGLVAAAPSSAACPNEGLRGGAFAGLPDCRAYELVTPADANGRTPIGISNFVGFLPTGALFAIEPIVASGDSFAFMTSNQPLGELGGLSGTLDVSEAQRLASGWKITRRFSPGEGLAVQPSSGGVSADHLYAFTDVAPVFKPGKGTLPGGTLAAEGDAQYLSKPDGSFELVGIGIVNGVPVTERLSQGRFISSGGHHMIFSTGQVKGGSYHCNSAQNCQVNRLADDAPPQGTGAIYDRSASGLARVVSLLPGDVTPDAGEDALYQGVSRDGTTVAFKIGGTLYVRVPDAGDGETLKVAEGGAVFAGLSEDGRYLFYVAGGEKGTIHRFDTSDANDVPVNPAVDGEVVNVSADGSHVYFIAEEEIGGNGEPDKPNLFVWEEGAPDRYIATVAPSDLVKTSQDEALGSYPALTRWTSIAVAPEGPGATELGPGADSSRTTPDGRVIVFESRAKLTGYENAGHTEIYRYEVGALGAECVSCNIGHAAASDARLQEVDLVRAPVVLNNLSADGSRVFFETGDALAPADIDGVNDVYEWHPEAGGPSVHLISSGQSNTWAVQPNVFNQPRPNVIYGITPSGSDVLFLSQDELVPGAGSKGTPQIYDAREGGGFPLPEQVNPCAEEGCRSSAPPTPQLQAPASETAQGANVRARRKQCHRHSKKHKKHSRCARPKKTKKPVKKGRAHASTTAAPIGAAPAAPATPSGTSAPAAVPVQATATASGPIKSAVAGAEQFGIEEVAAQSSTSSAGMHPDFTTTFSLNHSTENGIGYAANTAERITVNLPPGLLGNPNALPKCSIGDFLEFALKCPPDSQIGSANLLLGSFPEKIGDPVFNLEVPHPDKEVARFGIYRAVPIFLDVKVRTAGDYGATVTVHPAPGQLSLLKSTVTIWGNPAASAHDEQRLTEEEVIKCNDGQAPDDPGKACLQPEHKRPSGIPAADRKAFFSNPSACQEGSVGFEFTSYQLPGQRFAKSAPLAPISGCRGLPFSPSFSAEPTSHVAGAPTGLNTKLIVPQHLGEEEPATATMREAKVTLPEGMQIAAGAANWIGTCSDEQVGFHEEVDAACPDSSKLGTATITSPALSMPIEGNLYQRTPSPGHQFGLWLVGDELGLHIKLPGELRPDSSTGRLTAVFSDLPQVPVEEIDLSVWGGPKAPLENPDHCGTFATDFTFLPHSNDPAVSGQSQMQITEGCNQGFDPKLSAGVTDPVAGKFSPLIVDLAKADGQQNLRGFELKLPDGELAKIKGVPLCPDAAAASGGCPADSSIGSVTAAAGPGPEPFWVPAPGKPQPTVYLAGPYKGDPFSVVTVAPAQAGPFDLGNLVVRSGLGLDPDTNRAVVKADPLPQFFEGVGLTYRRLHILVDRPGFSLNPTDCSKLQVDSNVASTQGAVAHPSAPFGLEGCKKLKFKPKLALGLAGGTKRASYPALTAVLKARKGDANIAKASVALPHSEFLAQEHIGTICTRKQFAIDKCPKGSVYGRAKLWTPLLAKPLSGPVYLRSSDHLLPDLVIALGGELKASVVGRIDSKHGGIRVSFEAVPDAPFTKFVLKMRGGAKSLLTNSTNICAGKHQATVRMTAQNGRSLNSRNQLAVKGCGQG